MDIREKSNIGNANAEGAVMAESVIAQAEITPENFARSRIGTPGSTRAASLVSRSELRMCVISGSSISSKPSVMDPS